MDDDFVRYLNNFSYRVKVLRSLNRSPKLPSMLAKDCDILLNHISGVLNSLQDVGLVICLNPEARKGRIYRLTEEGKDAINYLK